MKSPVPGKVSSDGHDLSEVIWTPPDALRLLAVLGANLRLLLAATVLTVLATLIYLLTINPTYLVGAQLMLRPGVELAPPASVSVQANGPPVTISTRLEDVTAEVQILKDPALIHTVVTNLGEDFFLGEDPPATFFQKAKRAIKSGIKTAKDAVRDGFVKIGLLPELSDLDRVELFLQTSVEIIQVTRSDMIELSLSYPDPEAGEMVLSAFLEAYQARREEIFRDTRLPDYFAEKLAGMTADLTRAEEAFRQERDKLKAWSVEDQRSLSVARREDLVRMISDLESELATTVARRDEISRQLAETPNRITSSMSEQPNQLSNDLELRRIDLQLKLEAERRSGGSLTTAAQNLEQQLSLLEDLASQHPLRVPGEVVSVTNPLFDTLVANRSESDLQAAALRQAAQEKIKELARVDARLAEIDMASVKLAQMERNLSQLRESHSRFRRGSEEAQIAADLTTARISNLVVVADPKAGIAPVKPKPFRLLLIAAVGGFLLAAGMVLLMDALSPIIRSDADIARLAGAKVIVRAMPEVSGVRPPSRMTKAPQI